MAEISHALGGSRHFLTRTAHNSSDVFTIVNVDTTGAPRTICLNRYWILYGIVPSVLLGVALLGWLYAEGELFGFGAALAIAVPLSLVAFYSLYFARLIGWKIVIYPDRLEVYRFRRLLDEVHRADITAADHYRTNFYENFVMETADGRRLQIPIPDPAVRRAIEAFLLQDPTAAAASDPQDRMNWRRPVGRRNPL